MASPSWQEKLGEAFHRAVHGQPVKGPNMNHLHPRTDAVVPPTELNPTELDVTATAPENESIDKGWADHDEFVSHVRQLMYKIENHRSDYNELLKIAKTLETYVADGHERMKLASKILTDTRSPFTTVDIAGAIDDHINEIETHHRLTTMNSPKSLATQRYENLTQELINLETDTKGRVQEIERLTELIETHKSKIAHNHKLVAKIEADVAEVKEQMVTPLDDAVAHVKEQLLNVKEILNESK